MLVAFKTRTRERRDCRCLLLGTVTASRFYVTDGYKVDASPQRKFGTLGKSPDVQEPLGMIRTERLLLRPWRDEDYAPYAALNADPEVRRWWSAGTLSRDESNAQAEILRRHIEDHGFGFWAVEAPGVSPFIGFIGLLPVEKEMSFGPAIQAGWRLAREQWGNGYASEGAWAALDDGFGRLSLPEIVAYAVEGNMASRHVMERIGMDHDPADDFDHPLRTLDDPQRRHVLYRCQRPVA